ncbi:MAG: glycoside hydrolase family 26 protein [Streptosporangiaceae bacterium]
MVFIITLSVSAACAAVVIGRIQPGHATTVAKSYVAQCGFEPDVKLKHIHYFGIIADRKPGTANYAQFIDSAHPKGVKTTVTPTLVDYFVPFGAPWDPVPACYAVHHGALPVVQINLYHQNLAKIAKGAANNYLVHYADQVKEFGLPVVISLGHEMNGNWYPWGWRGSKKYHIKNVFHTGVSPRVFVQFWQTVHHIFTMQKAFNVIWLWTVNRAVRPATNPDPWWPGKQYVNWVGIDGHYTQPTDTFNYVFQSTIADVRQVTKDPILIAETAIRPSPARPTQLTDLYRTVMNTHGMIGVVYFDMKARFDWRLQDQKSLTVGDVPG